MQIVLLLVTNDFFLDHILVENTQLEVIAFSITLLLLLSDQVLIDIIIDLHHFHVLLSCFIEVNLGLIFTLPSCNSGLLLLLLLASISLILIILRLLQLWLTFLIWLRLLRVLQVIVILPQVLIVFTNRSFKNFLILMIQFFDQSLLEFLIAVEEQGVHI